MGIHYYGRNVGLVTDYLPLQWGDMWTSAELTLGAATNPLIPTYDTAATGDFDCAVQTGAGTLAHVWWTVVRIPGSYVAASNLTLKIDDIYTLGGDAVLVAATIDAEVFNYDSTNGDFSNADICATAAQSIANAYATDSFTLTGTNLTAGGELLVRFTSSIQITSAGAGGTGNNSFNNPRIEYSARSY